MSNIEQYNPNEPLLYQTFTPSIKLFPRHHPEIAAMSADFFFPTDGALQYIGETRSHYSFMIRYTHEDEQSLENVGIWFVMKLYVDDVVPSDILNHVNFRMHTDMPHTADLALYMPPSQKGSGSSIVLGSTIIVDEKATIGDMDNLFKKLYHVAPRVGTQFFGWPMVI